VFGGLERGVLLFLFRLFRLFRLWGLLWGWGLWGWELLLLITWEREIFFVAGGTSPCLHIPTKYPYSRTGDNCNRLFQAGSNHRPYSKLLT